MPKANVIELPARKREPNAVRFTVANLSGPEFKAGPKRRYIMDPENPRVRRRGPAVRIPYLDLSPQGRRQA